MSVNRPPIHILSTQVVPSPEVLFIIPAKIRSDSEEDVVFVYSTYIELYEVNNKGKLDFVAKKDDFDCRILAAKVLDICERPYIKEEEVSQITSNNELPPQLLVLKLSIPQFTLLHVRSNAQCNSESALKFVTNSWPMPIMPSDERIKGFPGILAVSANGLTVATEFGSQAICAHQIRPSRGMSQGMVVQDATVTLPKMIISEVDFLVPPSSDPHRVDMLVLGIENRRPIALVYHWKVENGLISCDPDQSKHAFGKEHYGIPLLLIPLSIAGAVMIIDERVLAIYQYGHDGSMQQMYCESFADAPHQHATSLRPPLWTAWTRPANMAEIPDNKDAIYLAREDGTIRYIEVGKVRDKFELFVDLTTTLDLTIDGACAAIAPSNLNSDILIIGGSGCDGGVFHVGLSLDGLQLRKEDQISDWSPFRDAVCAPMSQHNEAVPVGSEYSHESLFLSSGNAISGHTLKYEHHGRIEVAPRDLVNEITGINNLWMLDIAVGGGRIALCSSPWASTLCIGVEDVQQHFALGSEPTLAACAVFTNSVENLLIQITPSEYTLYNLGYLVHDAQNALAVVSRTMERTVLAAMDFPYFVLVKVVGNRYQLMLLRLLDGKDDCPESIEVTQIGAAVDLGHEPTACSFSKTHSQHTLIMLGYQDGRVELYSIDVETGTSKRETVSLESNGAIESIICVSRSCHLNLNRPCPEHGSSNCEFHQMLILCGLRTGQICTVRIPDVKTIDVLELAPATVESRLNVGTDSVKLLVDELYSNKAFFLCDGLLHQLEWSNNDFQEEVRIETLLLQRENSAGIMTSAITSVCRLPESRLSESSLEIGNRLAIACADSIHLGSVTGKTHLWHPRSLTQTAGRPKHLAYSQYLHALITSFLNFELDHSTKQQYITSTITICPVESFQTSIIKPEYPTISDSKSDSTNTWTSLPGETLTSLIEWRWPKARTSTLLIASFSFLDKDGVARGVLKYLKVTNPSSRSKSSPSQQHHFSLSHQTLESAPGYALCQFQRDTLVYGSGNMLRMRPFNWQEKRFTRGDEFRLPSAAVYVTAGEQYIYVTTHAHGVCVLALVASKLQMVSGDVQAREGIAHLALEEQNALLVTTKMGEVVALDLDAETGKIEESFFHTPPPLAFPSAITRLVKAAVRPPWKRTVIPGMRNREIYGTAVDGSLWNLSLLEPETFRLLHHVQSIFEADPAFSLAGSVEALGTKIPRDEHLMEQSRDVNVDGELLKRVVRRKDAVEVLETGGVSVELFQRVVSKYSQGNEYFAAKLGKADTRQHVEALVVWLREVLDVVI